MEKKRKKTNKIAKANKHKCNCVNATRNVARAQARAALAL